MSRMRTVMAGLAALGLLCASPLAQSRAANALTMYVVDVEGGNATLIISPSGESMLIDTANPGARDSDRIMAAAQDAGLKQVETVVTTHYHGDHIGGVADLAAKIPLKKFVDHGPNVETGAGPDRLMQRYAEVYGKATRVIVKPGDTIPVQGLDVRVVTAAGQVTKRALPGGGKANPFCAAFKPKDEDKSENAQSTGTVTTFGQFRMVHLGDLTWNKEFELMCPSNPIGTVDLLMASHHGLDVSNSAVLIHALQPRVVIMNNGLRKGGMPEPMNTIYASPGLEGVWQSHFSELGGADYSVPGVFIANPQTGPHEVGPAYWIKVVAQMNGTFTVTNSRNGFSKTYASPSR
jgi:competence protein ComEC